MSSSEYDKALQIELRPSRRYRRLIIATHLFSLLPLAAVVWVQPLAGLLLPAIALSLTLALRRLGAMNRWRWLRLHSDGRVVLFDATGQRLVGRIEPAPTLYAGLLILPINSQRRRDYQVLLRDSMDREAWRALQVTLRFHMNSEGEPVRG
ncbi:MAG: hypothetical protein HUJ29_07280 [Gammaproteobacteria bacterium]|nr:hypothetical protein [Gammaproteobacteria bacterium]